MFRKRFLSLALLVTLLVLQSVPRAQAQTYCDHAQFVSDLTAPDGSPFTAGTAFTKTWRVENVGTCTWTTAYNLVWVGGDALGAPASVKVPVDVSPGQMVDISVNLTAPVASGHYKGLFKISNAAGTQFGIGEAAGDPFWADINVVTVNAMIYDFVANASHAQWKSGAGLLPFPGTSGDSRGYAYQVDHPHLEDDSIDSTAGLLVIPQNKFNGYIQAAYPEFEVQQGDRLQTLVNCEFGASRCYVTFRIDYLLPNGVQRTLWSWKEAYDKRFYRADIDLSSLAGQKVRFVFMLLSTGFASGDRALWGSPRIVRTGSTQPPAPPATLTPLPPLPPTATPIGQPPPTIVPSGCDKATFVTDVTVPDGTIFAPGAAFTKTWRLKNAGTCTWTTSYKLIYFSGEPMSAPTTVNLPWSAAWGQTVDISVNMVAPTAAGKYRGYWILSNANGQYFGIGAGATDPVWAEINVAGEAPHEGGYNFWQNVCSAQWRSGAGVLPCPATEGDSKGFVIPLNNSHLEDGTMGPAPSLLIAPENKYNGYIQGIFPTFTIQPGDHFVSVVGCEHEYNCYVTFRLDYMTANGGIFNFWSWREKSDQKNYMTNVDLSPLAGRSVRFILTILATGSSTGDRVRWGAPSIVRGGGSPPPITITPTFTPTPTQTPVTITPSPSDWLTYTNTSFGFQFKYPPQGQIAEQDFNYIKMDLPFTQGTNLREKYLQVTARVVDPCQSPLSATSRPGSPTETVVINGISFLKQTGGDAGVGHLREWVGYSTTHNNTCISMDFMLHSLHAGNFATPPPVFDKTAESQVFTQMMSTFGWVTQPGDWSTYVNSTYGFQIKYPPQGERYFETPNSILIRLPIQPGTNLVEKYLQLQVLENYETCTDIGDSPDRELVVINGVTFLKETGLSQSAGQIRKVTTFFTQRDNICVSLPFILHSGNPNNYDPPIPTYDEAAESAVIMQMMTTFAWNAQALPDLTIDTLRIELQNTSCLAPDSVMGVRVWVRNNGQAAAGTFAVNVNGAEQTVNGLGVAQTTALFFPGGNNPVNVSVDSANAIAESNESNNSRSEMVAVPTPPLPCMTPTFTPTPTLIGPYAVIRVAPNDVLNIRLGAGSNYEVVGSFPSDAVDVMRFEGTLHAEGAVWYQVRRPDGQTGWVNSSYLTEYATHDAFCADERIPAMIEQLKGSMNQSNGDAFAGLVDPVHGVDVHLWAYQPSINFNTTTARTVFTSTESYNWGVGPRGGPDPDMGTFKDVIQPKMLEVFNEPNMETYCDNLTKAFPLGRPWPFSDRIHFYNLYKPASSAADLDFRTWLIGFEYINGQPYLRGLVTIVWEP